MTQTETSVFQYVKENSDSFLALFSHRYDFIYAAHPDPKEKPEWLSETRYPLSDRQMRKGDQLYGVRFETETQYFLIDIDAGSPYHCENTPLILERLFEVLEPVGITDHITCTSSDSKGLHVYFPIGKSFNSWRLSKAISTALDNAGFKLKPGCLEIFPNPKPYSTDKTPSLFNAHRLPLQMGSYILDSELQPICSSQTHFVSMWRLCQQRNVLNERRIKALLKKAKQVNHRLSNKASKFLSDLNAEIEEGWTNYGQTNRLLGRIAMRTFIFNHIIESGEPLTGVTLVEKIVSVAVASPGYKDWCRHQHEIKDRATEWARCIESSHYFAYGTAKGKYKELVEPRRIDSEFGYNQKKAQETQTKIVAAVKDLRLRGAFPLAATARFKALLDYSIGGASLYRYRELWHPIDLQETCGESGSQYETCEVISTEGANDLTTSTSLLPPDDSNCLIGKGLCELDNLDEAAGGSNCQDLVQKVRDRIKKQLAEAQDTRKLSQQNSGPVVEEAVTAVHKRALQRMREFLTSGEPILLAEAGRWLIKQPTTVRDELVGVDNDVPEGLLCDLAEISLQLVQRQLPPWTVRFQLEERFEKSLILELTDGERQTWVRSLQMQRASDDSS